MQNPDRLFVGSALSWFDKGHPSTSFLIEKRSDPYRKIGLRWESFSWSWVVVRKESSTTKKWGRCQDLTVFKIKQMASLRAPSTVSTREIQTRDSWPIRPNWNVVTLLEVSRPCHRKGRTFFPLRMRKRSFVASGKAWMNLRKNPTAREMIGSPTRKAAAKRTGWTANDNYPMWSSSTAIHICVPSTPHNS